MCEGQKGSQPEPRDIVHGNGLQYRKKYEDFFIHHDRVSRKPDKETQSIFIQEEMDQNEWYIQQEEVALQYIEYILK